MTTRVSFPIAKLLKEKGYDVPLNKFYLVQTDYTIFNKTGNPEKITFRNGDKWECANEPINWNAIHSETSRKFYSAPTIAEVVMWLYEKHGIWINVMKYKDHAADVNEPYSFTWDMGKTTHKMPTEAYLAAIEYAINNTIKQS